MTGEDLPAVKSVSLPAYIYCKLVMLFSAIMLLLYGVMAVSTGASSPSPGLAVVALFFGPALFLLWLIGCGMVAKSGVKVRTYHLLAWAALLPGILVLLTFV